MQHLLSTADLYPAFMFARGGAAEGRNATVLAPSMAAGDPGPFGSLGFSAGGICCTPAGGPGGRRGAVQGDRGGPGICAPDTARPSRISRRAGSFSSPVGDLGIYRRPAT